MTARLLSIAIGASILTALTAVCRADALELQDAGLRETVQSLSALDSRIPGYPGNRLAADALESVFRQLGLEDLKREEVTVTVPVDRGGTLQSPAGDEIALSLVWPNMVRTATLPGDGVSGELIYAGKGEYADFNGHELDGAIVALDFDCGANWLNAANLGARAVLFLDQPAMMRAEAERKFMEVPLNVPRFLVPLAECESVKQLDGQVVTVKGRMDWRRVTTWNLYGTIPGRDAKLADELVILSAYYDSMSVVPARAPGAESACGIAALIELVRGLQAQPPGRPVLVLATSAHFTGLRGIDDFVQRHCRQVDPFKAETAAAIRPALFIGLDLSSHGDSVGLVYNGDFLTGRDAFYLQRLFAPLGARFEDYAAEVTAEQDMPPGDLLVNVSSQKRGIPQESYVPDWIALDSELVLDAGYPSLSLVTLHDMRTRVDTPDDTVDHVDFTRLQRQVTLIKGILPRALADPGLFPESRIQLKDELHTLKGRIVTFNPRTSFVPDDPVDGAVAYIRRRVPSLMGVRGSFYEMTDENGAFAISRFKQETSEIEAYKIRGDDGAIVLAPDRGVNGAQMYPMSCEVDWTVKEHTIVLFPCVTTDLYELLDPRYLMQLWAVNVFDAMNATPPEFGYSMFGWTHGASYMGWTSDRYPHAVIFSSPGRRLKVGMASGRLGLRMLYLNSPSGDSQDEAEGKGYAVLDRQFMTQGAFRAAHDMLNLNEYRVRELARFGVINSRLNTMHARARDALTKAADYREQKNWDRFMVYSRRALGIESRAYPDMKGTADDVVRGIIFYMALLIPFAYFTERLLFTFADIKKQILTASGIFLLIYFIMRMVHPAFKISSAPEVILLGFVILTLSIVVLSIVSAKFQEQMEKMKAKHAKVYETDVGRATASAAAFSLGLSNMKRRKVRTALTCFTLVLLTFTVLSFSSVKQFMRFNKLPRPNTPAYEGALIRDRVWFPIEAAALQQIQAEFSEDARVIPRAWITSRKISGSHHQVQVREPETGKSVFALGALGLQPAEREATRPQRFVSSGRWFEDGDTNVCILPAKMAARLEIQPADVGKHEVHVLGLPLRVIGLIDSDAMHDVHDLDNERITPVDFTAMSAEEMRAISEVARLHRQVTLAESKAELASFTHLEMGNMIILPYELARDLGGTIRSVAVRFDDGVDIRERVEDFVARLAVTVFAGVEDEVTVYSSMAATSFSGMGNLFIPIMIAALIVLNTMMGAVHERFREIGVYSSVGLAPVHIGALFVAECCVFAILGAIAGYLLGQVVAKVLTTFGALAGLTLNYSSVSAVMSTLLVMIVVLLSTLYPARKASQLAVPDVTRRWILPDPDGDHWNFEFPFTIGGREILGLYAFFHEFFSSREEESVGHFYTRETRVSRFRHEDRDGYRISFTSWLAPFDLAVSQEVEMNAVPSGKRNIYEIHMVIRRLSGESKTWMRLNRRFLDIIRKQFLLWRTTSPAIKAEFGEHGRETFAPAGGTDGVQT